MQSMSPFDHKILDIRTAASSLEPLEVSIEEGKLFQEHCGQYLSLLLYF